MVVMPTDVGAPQKTAMLGQAMATAKRNEEKKLVLSFLPKCACVEALDVAEASLDNKALKAEAEQAIVAVVQANPSVARENPAKVRTILNKVIAGTQNRSVSQTANRVLKTNGNL